MDFSLNEEQAMLKESIEQYLEKSYSFDERMNIVDSDQPFDPSKWSDFAELGWLSLPFAEGDDGFGGGPVELMLIMQELGRHLVIEPYLSTVVMGGACVSQMSPSDKRKKLIDGVMAGEVQLAFAYAENRSRFNLSHVECAATSKGDGFTITGDKIVVLNGASADYLLVSARTSGGMTDSDGITLFCVEAHRDGVTRHGYRTVDGMHASHIQLKDVAVSEDDVIGTAGQGIEILEHTIQVATLAVCAEAVGIMDEMTQKTVAYTKEREQFGVPLSSFQALQHRMVEMFMELEQSRSLLLKAAIESDQKSDQAGSAIAALKYYIGKHGRKLGEEAVQMHGGMGVTYEMDIAHLFKRLTVIDTLFGNADYQLHQFMQA